MLNWDEYDESKTAPKPQQAQQEVHQQAPEPISEDAQEPLEQSYAPVESGDRAKQAKDAIQDLDLVWHLSLVLLYHQIRLVHNFVQAVLVHLH